MTEQANQWATQLALTEAPLATHLAQTATQEIVGSATAQVEATNTVISSYWNLIEAALSTDPIYGPVSGSLPHADDGSVETFAAGVSYQDVIITVGFYPPYSTDQNEWDVGIFFRDLGTNNELRLGLESDGTIFVIDRNGEDENYLIEEIISQPYLDLNALNTLILMISDDRGVFFLNGQFIKEFEISMRMEPGDVAVVTNIVKENFIPGAVTYFEDFTIYTLPEQ